MKVAIFTDNDFNKVNGVTTALSAVLAHAPSDITPRIYTCESSPVERAEYLALRAYGVGIPFYREMKMFLPPFRQFLKAARTDRIDLIHFTTPGPVGLAALWVASKHGVPMVGSFHTDLAAYTSLLSGSRQLGRLMREYMRWPYGKCRQILAPSESTRRLLVEGKIDPDKIRIWSRGVSTSRFDPAKRSEALRRRWGASAERPALIFVGRLSREKGLDLFPQLQQSLMRAGLDHRLIFVGDGPMRQELERTCPHAVFTGTLTPDDVGVAMASADVFVFPSRTDTAGNVVLEAQASGLPVLVSDCGGPQEQLLPHQTGEICARTSDYASAAITLLLDNTHRAQMSRAARAYALTRRWDLALEPLFGSYREDVHAHRAEALAHPTISTPTHVRPS
jgi:glycosyltransferase involved in cell wall biosynthesis